MLDEHNENAPSMCFSEPLSNPADHNDVYENSCALVQSIDFPTKESYSQILQKKSQHHQHEQIPLIKESVS